MKWGSFTRFDVSWDVAIQGMGGNLSVLSLKARVQRRCFPGALCVQRRPTTRRMGQIMRVVRRVEEPGD